MSTPPRCECARSRETVKGSDLAGWAEYGYCASHSRFFWGLRLHRLTHTTEDLGDWLSHWGVGDPSLHVGGLTERKPSTPAHEVHLVQHKTSMIGKDLGKTSGWAHRSVLKQSGVEQISGPAYDLIHERGLHLIGGEDVAAELDAKRAIEQGVRLAVGA